MDREALTALIAGDSQAAAMFATGNDSGCTARCLEIAEPVRCLVPTRGVQRAAILLGVWGPIRIGAENTSESAGVRSLCISIVDWLSDKDGTVDMDHTAVVSMLAGLVTAGKLTQAQSDELRALGDCPQVITVDEVSACRQ